MSERVCQFCVKVIQDGEECNCATNQKEAARIRKFESGATRDSDEDKLDYEAMLSPLVLKRYAEYMHKNRKLKDGSLRPGDNWQLGIPLTAYCKSLWRHFMDVWTIHRRRLTSEVTSYAEQDDLEEALCAVIFNASGYLHEQLQKPLLLAPAEASAEGYPPYPDVYEGIVDIPPPPPSYGWSE